MATAKRPQSSFQPGQNPTGRFERRHIGALPKGIHKPAHDNRLRRSTRLGSRAEAAALVASLQVEQELRQSYPKKRSRDEAEQQSGLNKRQRTSLSDNRTRKAASIDQWRKDGHWPKALFEMDCKDKTPLMNTNNQMLAIKRAGSLSRKRSVGGSTISSGEQSAEERKRTAVYEKPAYEQKLEDKGFYMWPDPDGPTEESLASLASLLQKEPLLPRDTIFDDPYFQRWCLAIRNKNEARLVRDMALLIVPSAETLRIRRELEIDCLTESVNEGWTATIPIEGPRPQPDFSVGFKRGAFTTEQLAKIQPALGDPIDQLSRFKATWDMYFPFLTCESKSSSGALDTADRQNAHSMAIALRAIVNLAQLAGREQDINRQILAISISHDDRNIRIYGYYPIFHVDRSTKNNVKFHRYPITEINVINDRWACYKFVKSFYQHWVHKHLERVCDILDVLPEASKTFPQTVERTGSQSTGLSQVTTESLNFEDADAVSLELKELETQPVTGPTPSTSMSSARKTKNPRREPMKS